NIVFPPGEVFRTITVPIIDDFVITTNLTVNLGLSDPTAPAILGFQPFATLTIGNIDSGISFTTSVQPPVAKNVPGGAAAIDVRRFGAINSSATVAFFTTTNGTAVTNLDYLPVSTNLTFNPGVTNLTVAIPIIDNGIPEGN